MKTPGSRPVVCLTTVGSLRDGEKIARKLVREKVVACVNLLPHILSFYHWRGKFCRDRETLLLMKTTRSKIPSLQKELIRIHPYQLPEFLVLSVMQGSKPYLAWVRKETRKRV